MISKPDIERCTSEDAEPKEVDFEIPLPLQNLVYLKIFNGNFMNYYWIIFS